MFTIAARLFNTICGFDVILIGKMGVHSNTTMLNTTIPYGVRQCKGVWTKIIYYIEIGQSQTLFGWCCILHIIPS